MVLKISSGYINFDQTFGGYRKHGVTVFASRPGMGTSTFMINSAYELAKQGVNVLFLSKSMSSNEFFRRTLSKLTNIPVVKLFNMNNMTKEDYELLKEKTKEAATINRDNLRFSNEFDLEEMKIKMINTKEKHNSSVVFIDNAGHSLTTEELEDFIAFTKKHELTLILNASLSRSIERRENKRPILADVPAWCVSDDQFDAYGFYRNEVIDPETAKENVLEVNCLNQREGTKTEFLVNVSRQVVQQ